MRLSFTSSERVQGESFTVYEVDQYNRCVRVRKFSEEIGVPYESCLATLRAAPILGVLSNPEAAEEFPVVPEPGEDGLQSLLVGHAAPATWR